MILIDINLLIYAHNERARDHAVARAWLESQFNEVRVGLPWATLLGFLRISTDMRIFPRPVRMADAWKVLTRWLELPTVWIPQPTDRHAEVLASLVAEPGVQGALVSDAHLAALAIEHGLMLCSTDGDFARFPRLKWTNPLAA